MKRKITVEWLKQVNACSESIDWFKEQKTSDTFELLNLLIKQDRLRWCNWGISRLLNKTNKIKYALFAAEQVIYIWKDKYPEDKRPQEAIEAVKRYLKNPSDKNREICRAAAYAADAHAAAAHAAAAAYAAYAAYADADAYVTKKAMFLKIIEYGIKLLKAESEQEATE